ncbi:hypothetical protein SHKM778_49910 [Streptomyces sp. KM77-8]|uniref:Uncharacterized protein n=1 Tax=Streptomyces haneummycinicus TaxID=3074435 RepID=A0AAT9HMV7_9ACTN
MVDEPVQVFQMLPDALDVTHARFLHADDLRCLRRDVRRPADVARVAGVAEVPRRDPVRRDVLGGAQGRRGGVPNGALEPRNTMQATSTVPASNRVLLPSTFASSPPAHPASDVSCTRIGDGVAGSR